MKSMRTLLLAALVLMAPAALVVADDCGGNCISDCAQCPCGRDTQYIDIASACAKFSGWDQGACQCIVGKESNGNAHAAHYIPQYNSYDIGVWQIDSENWGDCNSGNAPCDVQSNLNCAMDLWREAGGNWAWWATCNDCGLSPCDGSVAQINPEWDGTWPEWYDASRPFRAGANKNITDPRIMESRDYIMPNQRNNGKSQPRKHTLKQH